MVSEFHCEFGGVGRDSIYYTVEAFNKFLIHHIHLKLSGHYERQSRYIDPDPRYAPVRILKLENITPDFGELTEENEHLYLVLIFLRISTQSHTRYNFYR